jgi:SAM-dependent methyltransferase
VTEADVPVAGRLVQLLRHLGLEQAHVAGAMPGDWRGLAGDHADRVASLSLVCPTGFDPSAVAGIASRLLVIHGDRGATADRARAAVARLPEASLVVLPDYAGLLFADVTVERGDAVGSSLITFVERVERKRPTRPVARSPARGEFAGISYRVEGGGPPLMLLPLALAPSQWDPLLARLRERFCTISVSGPHVGFMPILEGRAASPGYRRMVRTVVEAAGPRSGEKILDVGCGSGAVIRWLAEHTHRGHAFTGVDINRYLLREAQALVDTAGLHDVITLKEGNGEAIPFEASRVDVTLSLTVMEEGDAERMLTELVRVTRPGGRVAVIVRGEDVPAILTVPLRPELHAKALRALPTGVVEGGCADASLYRRFHAAGLVDIRKLPQFAVYDDPRAVMPQYYQSRVLSALAPEEADEWRAGVARTEAEGAFVLGVPHHCAVGTKPG